MQEIKVKDNPTGLNVYINAMPSISLMPIDELNLLISGLEVQMIEHFKNKKRKSKQSP